MRPPWAAAATASWCRAAANRNCAASRRAAASSRPRRRSTPWRGDSRRPPRFEADSRASPAAVCRWSRAPTPCSTDTAATARRKSRRCAPRTPRRRRPPTQIRARRPRGWPRRAARRDCKMRARRRCAPARASAPRPPGARHSATRARPVSAGQPPSPVSKAGWSARPSWTRESEAASVGTGREQKDGVAIDIATAVAAGAVVVHGTPRAIAV